MITDIYNLAARQWGIYRMQRTVMRDLGLTWVFAKTYWRGRAVDMARERAGADIIDRIDDEGATMRRDYPGQYSFRGGIICLYDRCAEHRAAHGVNPDVRDMLAVMKKDYDARVEKYVARFPA